MNRVSQFTPQNWFTVNTVHESKGADESPIDYLGNDIQPSATQQKYSVPEEDLYPYWLTVGLLYRRIAELSTGGESVTER